MNSRNRYLYLLPAMLLMACMAGERRTVTINRTWPADGIHRVHVNEVNGGVNVEAGNTNEITLVAHVRAYEKPKPNEDNQGYFKSDVNGDTLEIGRKNRHHITIIGFNFGDDVTVDYSLRVPPQRTCGDVKESRRLGEPVPLGPVQEKRSDGSPLASGHFAAPVLTFQGLLSPIVGIHVPTIV